MSLDLASLLRLLCEPWQHWHKFQSLQVSTLVGMQSSTSLRPTTPPHPHHHHHTTHSAHLLQHIRLHFTFPASAKKHCHGCSDPRNIYRALTNYDMSVCQLIVHNTGATKHRGNNWFWIIYSLTVYNKHKSHSVSNVLICGASVLQNDKVLHLNKVVVLLCITLKHIQTITLYQACLPWN